MVDDNEDTDDSDIEEQVDDILLHNCLLHQLGAHLIASVFLTSLLEEKKQHEASLFDQRLNWERFAKSMETERVSINTRECQRRHLISFFLF
jgi:hypothetical protein